MGLAKRQAGGDAHSRRPGCRRAAVLDTQELHDEESFGRRGIVQVHLNLECRPGRSVTMARRRPSTPHRSSDSIPICAWRLAWPESGRDCRFASRGGHLNSKPLRRAVAARSASAAPGGVSLDEATTTGVPTIAQLTGSPDRPKGFHRSPHVGHHRQSARRTWIPDQNRNRQDGRCGYLKQTVPNRRSSTVPIGAPMRFRRQPVSLCQQDSCAEGMTEPSRL